MAEPIIQTTATVFSVTHENKMIFTCRYLPTTRQFSVGTVNVLTWLSPDAAQRFAEWVIAINTSHNI